MKIKKLICVVILFLCPLLSTFGQSGTGNEVLKYPEPAKKYFLLDLGLAFNNYIDRGILGFSGDAKFKVFDDFQTGVNIDWSRSDINDRFGQAVTGPILEVVSLSWITHYNWLNEDNVKAGPMLGLGYMTALLEDKDQTEPYYYKLGLRLHSKVIKTNSYLDLDPGLFLTINIYNNLWLAAKYKYRLLIGGDTFARQRDFRGSAFVISISYYTELTDKPAKSRPTNPY